MIREQIEQVVAEALKTLGAEGVAFTVERPASMEHGDYATNAALAAAKVLKKNPREVAEEIQKNLEGKIEGVKKIEVAGAGFINFTISGMTIKDIVHKAQESEWGSNELYKNKKVMVEYTDPNPFKEFHIGHLMSNAIGESIARLLSVSGASVTRANYQGDVGLHVAKAIWGYKEIQDPKYGWSRDKHPWEKDIEVSKWAFAYKFGSTKYEEGAEVKKQVDLLNKEIYENQENIPEYKIGREISLKHFEELYKTLGTKFEHYFFESETTPIGVELVKSHGEVFVESEGARVFRGEEESLHTRVFLTSQGLPTYEAKDLGLLKLKRAFDIETSITVTASEQNEYFKVVLAAAKHLPEVKDIAEKTKHVSHGMMRFAEGKMSSRKGNVVTGESLLTDLKDTAKEKMQERKLTNADAVAQDVAVGAIKFVVLKQGSSKDIIFDPEKSLSLEGDSGPYLQYALVRARALLRNAANAEVVQPESSGPKVVERLVMHFPDVVEHAAQELEPHYVTTFLTELAGSFNSWYASERMIVDGKITTRNLAVVKAIENTLARGLQILGIPTPEEM